MLQPGIGVAITVLRKAVGPLGRPSLRYSFLREEETEMLVIERGREPNKGKLAPPGGRIHLGERIGEAACRELREETGISVREEALSPVFFVNEAVVHGAYHWVVLHV